ncbi:MAG: NACHT domain-containing protein, partial [Ghiorsea sp.]|nr:NACHT domain-containing protein [Ghiorsea sp.]
MINEKFPEDKTPSALEKERSFHAAFARSRLQSYIADEDAFKNIFNHIQTQGSPLLVTGKMGSGKSALLANFVQRWRQKQQDGMVIEHYAGAGGEADVLGVLRRVMNEIKQAFNRDEDIPTQPDNVFQDFALWLLKVDKPLLLVLDGVNQFHGDIKRLMYALPENLGEHVRIIFSAINDEALHIANKPKWKSIQVAALTQDKRQQLVEEYLAQYNKSLGADFTNALVHSDMGDNPLFLRVVMDELRVDATHDQLQSMLDFYLKAKNLVQLFDKVLDRCERMYKHSNVSLMMKLVYTSRYGLSETELREICGKS